MTDRRLTDWGSMTLGDLGLAYRKAKVDCFRERGQFDALEFARYEQNLGRNLKCLLTAIHGGTGAIDEVLDRGVREPAVLPKCLRLEARKDQGEHCFFSNAKDYLDYLTGQPPRAELVPELRIAGGFSVDVHVISALWIDLVGHRLDERLSRSAYGSRLRRLRSDEVGCQPQYVYHARALGSFPPYIQPYQRWKDEGMGAIRRELEAGNRVIVLAFDLRSYYHHIDPDFVTQSAFLEYLGVILNAFELEFTGLLSGFYKRWGTLARTQLGISTHIPVGLPIGLAAPRVLANVLLHKWDCAVEADLQPIFYGRYVDDMLLVLRNGNSSDTACGLQCIVNRMQSVALQKGKPEPNETSPRWTLDLGQDYQAKSVLQFQDAKSKTFRLEGQTGIDLLDRIKAQIADIASERRLLPDPETWNERAATKVLVASNRVEDEPDSLGRAEGLTMRRLGWSLQLRSFEMLARDLPPNEWKKRRHEFFRFAHDHVLRFDRILEQGDHLARLIGLAVACGDWKASLRLVQCILDELAQIEVRKSAIVVNGEKLTAPAEWGSVWEHLTATLKKSIVECILRSWPWVRCTPRAESPSIVSSVPRTPKVHSDALLTRLGITWDPLDVTSIVEADLARAPLHVFRRDHGLPLGADVEAALDLAAVNATWTDIATLREFLVSTFGLRVEGARGSKHQAESLPESIVPYVFPTRPLKPEQVTELVPRCVGLDTGPKHGDDSWTPAMRWARIVRSLRGVWVRPALLEPTGDDGEEPDQGRYRQGVVRFGGPTRRSKPKVAIGSLETNMDAWRGAAAGRPVLTERRYSALTRLVNSVIELRPRPDYLLLPELSIPERWVDSIANQLIDAGICLIGGVEYRRLPHQRVANEAIVVLSDDRMGYPAQARIRQRKGRPAPGEQQELTTHFGLRWDDRSDMRLARKRPVYLHQGLSFAVLICSELQNIKYRTRHQGKVDALFVLSWNQDLETFDALIESAALDVHAYIAYANNRLFGDSRVRSPAKDSWMRDICRIRGGENDYAVVVELDVDRLREFQSRATPWPSKDDPFKPVPEGFKIARYRRRVPR